MPLKCHCRGTRVTEPSLNVRSVLLIFLFWSERPRFFHILVSLGEEVSLLLGAHSLSLEREMSTGVLANFSREFAKFRRELANFKREFAEFKRFGRF